MSNSKLVCNITGICLAHPNHPTHPETTPKTNFGNFDPIWMKLGGDHPIHLSTPFRRGPKCFSHFCCCCCYCCGFCCYCCCCRIVVVDVVFVVVVVTFQRSEFPLQRMRHRGAEGGRADDNEATMKARLKTFKKHAEAVVGYFRDSKRLIEVNAEDRVDSVFYETCLALRARGIFPGLKKSGGKCH